MPVTSVTESLIIESEPRGVCMVFLTVDKRVTYILKSVPAGLYLVTSMMIVLVVVYIMMMMVVVVVNKIMMMVVVVVMIMMMMTTVMFTKTPYCLVV